MATPIITMAETPTAIQNQAITEQALTKILAPGIEEMAPWKPQEESNETMELI